MVFPIIQALSVGILVIFIIEAFLYAKLIKILKKLENDYKNQLNNMVKNNSAAVRQIHKLKTTHSAFNHHLLSLKEEVHHLRSTKKPQVRKKKVRGKKRHSK